MGFWGFLIIFGVVLIVCRMLAELFPIIRDIMFLASWGFGIVIGFLNGFWWGVLALVGALACTLILFGSGESRTRRGNLIKCANCGCDHVKIVEENDETVVYKCPDCERVGSYILRH